MLRRALVVALAATLVLALLPALPAMAQGPPTVVDDQIDGLPAADAGQGDDQESGELGTLESRAGDTPSLRSAPIETPIAFTMIGFGLPEGANDIEFRVSEDGEEWTDWTETELAVDENEGPDVGSEEHVEARAAGSENKTEPVWVGEATHLEVRGVDPSAVEVHLIDSDGVSHGLGDEAISYLRGLFSPQPQQAHASDGSPDIITRAEWGADESWRNNSPRTASNVEYGVVHHTAGSNSYSEAQAPAVVRGIYRYHTQTLGWADIGYNFLVDRFGNTYEGRAGGMTAGVVGAHAQGFNTGSVGVSVMGEFTSWTPAWEAQTAIADVLAWQFVVHDIDPKEQIQVRSGGSNRWSSGTQVDMSTIIGHRDVGYTACPGNAYYNQLPALRDMVDDRMGDFVDTAADSGSGSADPPPAHYPVRLNVSWRPFQLSELAAEWYWGSGTSEAVLASEEDYADALAGAVVAAEREAPLLLTPEDSLDGHVADRLGDLGVDRVTLLGGEAALSPAVENAVAALGIATDRLRGHDRFATAAAVAGEVGARTGEAVIALGRHEEFRRAWPDAMSAASLAGSPDRIPTLLTREDRVPDETIDALRDLGIDRVHVLGGESAISSDVVRELEAQGLAVQRHSGPTRYGTSLAVLEEALERWDDPQVPLVLASGESYPHALIAGSVAAQRNGPMLLVHPTDMDRIPEIQSFLDNDERLIGPLLIGDSDEVSDAVRAELGQWWPDDGDGQ